MKKLIYFLIPLFLFIPRVNAQIVDYDISLNGSALTTRGYKTIPANSYATMTITATNTTSSGYFRVQTCFDANVTAYYLSNTSYFSDPLVVRTKVPCTYYNSTYKGGTVTNFYFNYDVSASGATSFTTSFNFLNFGGSLGLLSVASSDTPFDVSAGLDYSNTNVDVDIDTSGIEQKQAQTNQKLDDIDDTLNDDTIDSSNTTGTLEDLSGDLPTNSVISDLLLLPVRLFQNVINSINGSCVAFNLGSLYGSNLTLPCINIESLIGSTLWSIIDILFCGAFVLVIRKKFVDIFHNLTDLRNGGNELE